MIIFEQNIKMKRYILFVLLSVISIAAQAHSDIVDKFIVVIDRGHDEVDLGVQVDGESEYEILSSLVAQITGEVKESIEVIYYNPTGERLTIMERAARINALNPDLVISIHMDATSNGPRQAGIVFSDENKGLKKSKEYAALLITHLAKDAYFSTIRTETSGMALLNKVNAPAFVLLIGNMNATRDRYYLQTNGAQRLKVNFTAFLNELN